MTFSTFTRSTTEQRTERAPRLRVASRSKPRAMSAVVIGGAVLLALAAWFVSTPARAAGPSVALESPRIDQGNIRSLQAGARHFINNCMGCHSVEFSRYSRVAEDLGLSEEDVAENFIFTTDAEGEPTKVGATMVNNMSREYGEQAFGIKPPDLSLTARSRGKDWIYSFLKAYYKDPERTGTGSNNLVYPGTAMPHVLWNYQGWQTLSEGDDGHGGTVKTLELTEPGSLSADEYDTMIADITNFLGYVSDPIKETRHRMGFWVILFLFGLLAIAYFLKKEYWKDVV